MASLFDVSTMTINTKEVEAEIGKAIIEKGFVNGVLADDHEIETGVAYDTQIPFIGSMADSLKASVGCTPNVGSGISLSEKVWTPKNFDTRLEHCEADANPLFKLFKKAVKMNPDFYDQIDSEGLGVVYAALEKMLNDALPDKVWFSDTSADDIAGGGVFKNGTDLDLYNVIDGLFKQIIEDAGIARVTITENAGASYAAQTLADDASYDYLEKIVETADSRLLDADNAILYVTRSVADNYRKTLRSKTLGAGFIEITENGKSRLMFDGYEVRVKYGWDRFIKSKQDNGTKWNLPHRIVFTIKENIPVATLSQDDLKKLDVFYDQYRKSNVIDVVFSLDTKHLEDYMTVKAY